MSKERDKERKFWKGVFSQKIIIINIFLRGLLQSTFPDVVFVKVSISLISEKLILRLKGGLKSAVDLRGFFFFFFLPNFNGERGDTMLLI